MTLIPIVSSENCKIKFLFTKIINLNVESYVGGNVLNQFIISMQHVHPIGLRSYLLREYTAAVSG